MEDPFTLFSFPFVATLAVFFFRYSRHMDTRIGSRIGITLILLLFVPNVISAILAFFGFLIYVLLGLPKFNGNSSEYTDQIVAILIYGIVGLASVLTVRAIALRNKQEEENQNQSAHTTPASAPR